MMDFEAVDGIPSGLLWTGVCQSAMEPEKVVAVMTIGVGRFMWWGDAF